MSSYQCPKGHESTEPDYCSECGTKINGTSESAATGFPTTGIVCPDCTAPHEADSGDFCEICGYNFTTGVRGEVPPVAIQETPVTLSNQATVKQNPPVVVKQAIALEIVITVDPALRADGSPEPPMHQPPITLRLHEPSNLIGRTSEIRRIHPEIPLDFDEAVSHRHALLNRQPDGIFVLRDIGSTNGTTLNGVELAPLVDTPLQVGDEFTLGHWTRIKVQQLIHAED
jgi:pSer/pThr/pTyr-binding forkhead associated (FHA) protein